MKKCKVLVTGANSMLASHVIGCLLSRGYRVRGIVRRRESYRLPPHPDAELFIGDFTDSRTVEYAVEGCEAIVHIAAVTAQNLTNYDEYRRVNVAATRMLAAMAHIKGVKRFVFVSSANTAAYGSKAHPGDETRPAAPPFDRSFYARSKAEAEQAIASLWSDTTDFVTVCPSFMIGRYGSLRKGSDSIIGMALGRRTVVCPPGGKSFVAAADVAQAVAEAMERGCRGEKYLLTGENLSYKEFYLRMAAIEGMRKKVVVLPRAVIMITGVAGSLLRLLGLRLSLSLTNARILCVGNYYDSSKAAAELGFAPRNIDRAIAEVIEEHERGE